MSYPWANDLIYTLTGNTPPPRQQRPSERQPAATGNRSEAAPQRVSFQALFTAAAQQAPHWRSMTLRLPQCGAAQMTVMLEEASALHPYPRSILTLDAATAAVVQWEPYGSNLGRTIRSWVRPLHTGEAGGLVGQSVAALASAGGVVLVWTGFALAWRRFFGRRTGGRSHEPDIPQQ
jgi:uncharacterized iron-regulated membrane protein